MTGLSSALRIGTNGLNVAQASLAMVSHNVVNANTPGFSRQIAISGSTSINGSGTGVALSEIQRVTDKFINFRSTQATSDTSYAQTRKSYLDTLEGVMTGGSAQGGLETLAANFFTSVTELSNDPSKSALKRNVVQQAELMTKTIRDIADDLTTTATDADTTITAELATINQILKDISKLNTEISAISLNRNDGGSGSDLKDARDNKITELAKLLKLQKAVDESSGSVRVTLENGRRLVDYAGFVQIKRVAGVPYQGLSVQSVQVDGTLALTELPIYADSLTSGKLKALIDTRDTLVPNLQAQLDTFTNTFRTEFNKIASQGSSTPPQASLTSANTIGNVVGVTTDLYTTAGFTGLPGSSFHLSVTNSLGQPVLTTQPAAAITLPAGGPYSITDIANLINNNPTVGNTALGGLNGVIASAQIDSSGRPYLQIQTANSSQRVVLASNGGGDFLGLMGMNNVLTGVNASDFAIDSKFINNPELLPIARMRTTDGGLSNLDNRNILALGALADSKLTFSASGGLGVQNTTVSDYAGQIVSNLTVVINDAKDRVNFTTNVSTQLENLRSEISGVNVDEELAQMLVYQNSFQASARIISVVNQLLDELTSILR
jgi:flagellar hook-associated protein 1 FlgK